VPPFPGLRQFPDGRDYNQWTGDDSKATTNPGGVGKTPPNLTVGTLLDLVPPPSRYLPTAHRAREEETETIISVE
jgi:hypothetical protein